MTDIRTRTISDIDACHELWEKFSPKENIYDLWEFRLPFYEEYQYKPGFVVISDNGEDVCLLPLWYIPEQKKYFWFGDIGDGMDWQEENTFWVKDVKYLNTLIKICPRPAVLNSLKAKDIGSLFSDAEIKKNNPKHILDLINCGSMEGYLSSVAKKLRSNLRRDKRRIDALKPEIHTDKFEDFAQLIDFNVKRFHDSYLKDSRLVRVFEKLIRRGTKNSPYRSHMLSVVINGKTAGVDLVFIYNGTYSPMLCGNRVDEFPGIGNYLNLLDIEDAIMSGMIKIDFQESDENSYKEKFFQTIKLHSCFLSD